MSIKLRKAKLFFKIRLKKIAFGFSFTLAIMLTSCAGFQTSKLTNQLHVNNCKHQDFDVYSKEKLPKPLHELHLDSVLLSNLSFQSLNVANAIGLLDFLTEYLRLKESYSANPSHDKKLQMMELSQKINQRILISSLEISAVASELDCEEERADQIATYLKGKEDEAETRMTVGAIVTGAIGAVAAGVLLAINDVGNIPELIGIGTGLIEATLGVLILTNKRSIYFNHPRNALREIWSAPETSSVFPSSVWYYLNYENPEKNEISVRQQLVDKWLGFGQIADTKEKNKEKIYQLFFGEGGKYTADQLTNRANMYDQIEAQINLMKQDLKLLASELEKFLYD